MSRLRSRWRTRLASSSFILPRFSAIPLVLASKNAPREGGPPPRRFVPLMIPVVIVVEDRPDPLRGDELCVTARPAQVDEEGFVRLLHLVGDDNDGDSHG